MALVASVFFQQRRIPLFFCVVQCCQDAGTRCTHKAERAAMLRFRIIHAANRPTQEAVAVRARTERQPSPREYWLHEHHDWRSSRFAYRYIYEVELKNVTSFTIDEPDVPTTQDSHCCTEPSWCHYARRHQTARRVTSKETWIKWLESSVLIPAVAEGAKPTRGPKKEKGGTIQLLSFRGARTHQLRRGIKSDPAAGAS